MTAPDIDLIEMGDTTIARRDGDILELDVHVILGLEQFAAVDLAGGEFERDDMTLSSTIFVQK